MMGGGSKRMQRRQSPIIVRTGRVELAMLRRERECSMPIEPHLIGNTFDSGLNNLYPKIVVPTMYTNFG